MTGEGFTDTSVLVVKTHQPLGPFSAVKYDKVILIVRDPFETIQAEFNRRLSGSPTEHATIEMYERHFKSFAYSAAIEWESLNTYWFNRFPDPSNTYLLFYDDLVRDTQHQLEKALEFLNMDITANHMKCVMTHKDGLYRRPKKNYDFKIFDDKMKKTINDIKNRVYGLLNAKTNTTIHSSPCA